MSSPDLTVLYYTANRIAEPFAQAVRAELRATIWDRYPVVAVTQTPIGFGPLVTFEPPSVRGAEICVGEIGASIYNCYQQILIAATAADTPFVACAEDDSLYVPEHFAFRPPRDAFAYNQHRWVITRRLSADRRRREAIYYFRRRHQMAMLVCSRDLLVETLEERFAKFPEPVSHDEAKRTGWGEPGRYERNLGLTRRTLMAFETALPCVTFNHHASLMGRRQMQTTDRVLTELEPWGNADVLWRRIHGA